MPRFEAPVRLGAAASLVAAACTFFTPPAADLGVATFLLLLAGCAHVVQGVGLAAALHHRGGRLSGALLAHAGTLVGAAMLALALVRLGAVDPDGRAADGRLLYPLVLLLPAVPRGLFVGVLTLGGRRCGVLPVPLQAAGWVALAFLALPMVGAMSPAPVDATWARWAWIAWLLVVGGWFLLGRPGQGEPGDAATAPGAGPAGPGSPPVEDPPTQA